jgi:hypothetical protein
MFFCLGQIFHLRPQSFLEFKKKIQSVNLKDIAKILENFTKLLKPQNWKRKDHVNIHKYMMKCACVFFKKNYVVEVASFA